MNALKTYEPKNLEKWTLPSSYIGATHENSYMFLGQNRDSDVLTRSNFEVALKRLGGESETVQVIREGHWAVGWIEWIKIDACNVNALKLADEMMDDLDDYPILDESHFSEKEHNENYDYLQRELSYFLGQLCEELDIQEETLTKDEKETLEQFIEGAFFAEADYSGEAYFNAQDVSYRVFSEYDYFKTMENSSKKMVQLLEEKYGE